MTIPLSQCRYCKNLIGEGQERFSIICPAFPDGIPDFMRYNEFDHRNKHPEQTGDTVYEPSDPDMDVWKFEEEDEDDEEEQ